MTFEAPKPDLRASDADREAAADRLRVAATEGRLDPAELDERMSRAYGARWCSELATLTADITPAPAPVASRPTFERRQSGTNGLAIAALVCGLLWMWWIGSVLAVVFGHVALGQIRNSPVPQGGRGLAIAGTVLGYLGLLTLLAAIVAVLVD
jgi:hypothetical protein